MLRGQDGRPPRYPGHLESQDGCRAKIRKGHGDRSPSCPAGLGVGRSPLFGQQRPGPPECTGVCCQLAEGNTWQRFPKDDEHTA